MKINPLHHNLSTADFCRQADKKQNGQKDFAGLLRQKIEKRDQNGIKISNHARQRIAKRNINMNPQDLQKLNRALDMAKQKGSRETLVYYNNNAYLFNVKTNTLITAIDNNSMQGNVITNIDSTVFM